MSEALFQRQSGMRDCRRAVPRGYLGGGGCVVNDLQDMIEQHAEAIIRASGSSLRNYETRSKADIMMGVADAIKSGMKAGAARIIAKLKERGMA